MGLELAWINRKLACGLPDKPNRMKNQLLWGGPNPPKKKGEASTLNFFALGANPPPTEPPGRNRPPPPRSPASRFPPLRPRRAGAGRWRTAAWPRAPGGSPPRRGLGVSERKTTGEQEGGAGGAGERNQMDFSERKLYGYRSFVGVPWENPENGDLFLFGLKFGPMDPCAHRTGSSQRLPL